MARTPESLKFTQDPSTDQMIVRGIINAIEFGYITEEDGRKMLGEDFSSVPSPNSSSK